MRFHQSNSRAKLAILLFVCLVLAGQSANAEDPFVLVLGVAQDAGYPQAGCSKDCCRAAWDNPSLKRYATSLAIVDPDSQQRWLLDCTPDFREQLRMLDSAAPKNQTSTGPFVDGIFLTHAHIGHYSGLIHLGREVIGAKSVSVFAMPRMTDFLKQNGPWQQLVELQNIELQPLVADKPVRLNARLTLKPFLVPHRDEYSETVGFEVIGPSRKVLFIPDIDKWEKWDRHIEDLVANVDVAYVDGTFFGNGEIPGRDMSLIPHPSIEESLQRFAKLPVDVRSRVRFIHLNHTNPALRNDSAATRLIRESGCHVAEQAERQGV